MKIHIIGCSGSGKTYLANALSKKYNISHFDLDDIQWDNNAKEYGKKRTLDERKALLQEILYNNDEWIVEGVYYAWVRQSFDEAAVAVYFGDWIKVLVKLNLVALLLLVQAVYVGIRVYVKGCKRARGYY